MTECLRSGDSVNLQMPRGLVPHHGALGERAVPTVDRTGREACGGQFPLQVTDQRRSSSGVSLAGIQNGLSRREGAQGEWAGDAVDSQPMASLKGDHRAFRQRSVPSVDETWRVAQGDQATLDCLHRRRAIAGPVAGAQRQQLGVRALALGRGPARVLGVCFV
jgi:hypothetical protein